MDDAWQGAKAIKIAYVMDAIYPYNMGGADKRLWELARKLAENGEQEVHIYGIKWARARYNHDRQRAPARRLQG